jgi:nicotinate-nucleotide adenylyltransferase
MHIAIFGGSFDPPHVGHMMACYYLLEVHEADEVMLVPVYTHPFGKTLTGFGHRLEMCRLAAEPFGARVSVSPIEQQLNRGGPVYTVDLLEELRKRHPDDKLSFVMGSDALTETHEWKDFDRVRELANLIVLRRRGYEDAAESYKCLLPELSSSAVREAFLRGTDTEGLVPARVRRYIHMEGLYGRAGG